MLHNHHYEGMLYHILHTNIGKTVDATITKAKPSFDHKDIKVTFYFTDDAGKHHKRMKIYPSNEWEMPESRTLKVVYLTNEPETFRLVSQKNNFAPIALAVISTAIVLFFAYMIWQARREMRTMRQ